MVNCNSLCELCAESSTYINILYICVYKYHDPVLLKIEWAILAAYNILCLEKILERKHVALVA